MFTCAVHVCSRALFTRAIHMRSRALFTHAIRMFSSLCYSRVLTCAVHACYSHVLFTVLFTCAHLCCSRLLFACSGHCVVHLCCSRVLFVCAVHVFYSRVLFTCVVHDTTNIQEHSLWLFKCVVERMLRKVMWFKVQEVTGGWGPSCNVRINGIHSDLLHKLSIQGIHKRMVRFQKVIRNLFLTLHGHNLHRQQRKLSKFLMR